MVRSSVKHTCKAQVHCIGFGSSPMGTHVVRKLKSVRPHNEKTSVSGVQRGSLCVCFRDNCVATPGEVQRGDLRESQTDLGEPQSKLAALARTTKERVCCHNSTD